MAINSHQLWITGGLNGYNYLASTEIVDLTSYPAATVDQGPEMPIPMYGHCLVKLNESTVLFMYGYQTFFFDHSAAQAWTNGPDMIYNRLWFGCGMMQMGDGSTAIVVAGGASSPTKTEFLVLDDPNGMKWSVGRVTLP